jgi:6-phosphofructokinase 1
MGRNSGFIAAYSTLASREVDCCLVPEVPFPLGGPDGVLEYIEGVLDKQRQCVVVIAEGAGKEHVDSQGNIGIFLLDALKSYFKERKREISYKYLDPTYQVRALPAIASDNILCTLLAHSAVHASMAGYTGFCAGTINGHNVMIPLERISGIQKRLDPSGRMWQRILSSTQQPDWAASTVDSTHKVDLVKETPSAVVGTGGIIG